MKVNVEKQPKSTLKITITVENDKVKKAYDKVLEETVKTTEIEGFRKGNAPKNMVEDKIGVSNLYGHVVDHLLKEFYTQALKENKISPVSNPRVEIKEFDIDKDFEFNAVVAIRPEIKVKEYKKALKKAFEDKKKEIEKQKAEALKKGEQIPEIPAHLGANEVIKILLEDSEVEVADILIQEESDRVIGRLLDQLRGINLSMEKYLKAQEKTADGLRKEYDEISEKSIKAEFVMSHLIQKEGIEVTDKEIDEMVGALGDPKTAERMQSPMERLYIKTILQKNKLIGKLIEDAEKEDKK
ncbi:MAG: trigger factor [Patescibacteria group bacterium]